MLLYLVSKLRKRLAFFVLSARNAAFFVFLHIKRHDITFVARKLHRFIDAYTGKEFCDILGVDYDAIVKIRRDDTTDNFKYVVEKMFEIKEVRSLISEEKRKHILENDFYNTDGVEVLDN